MNRPSVSDLPVVAGLSQDIVAAAAALHAGAARGYHGWGHPLALMALHAEVREQLHDPLAVVCAILFHDAVYDPRAADNERRSAQLAESVLDSAVPAETLRRALRLIGATERHAIPDDLPAAEREDAAMFLDMDLSILGGAAARFDAYEAGVRHEYAEVPEPAFRAGRAAILRGFLGRETLYLSAWGQARFEAAARANLARSIAVLVA